MSKEDAKQFAKILSENEELGVSLNRRLGIHESEDPVKLGDVRERLKEVLPSLAEEKGYEITAEEGVEALTSLPDSDDRKTLSDEELEEVSGGGSSSTYVCVSDSSLHVNVDQS